MAGQIKKHYVCMFLTSVLMPKGKMVHKKDFTVKTENKIILEVSAKQCFKVLSIL